jgi:hypothetical protein
MLFHEDKLIPAAQIDLEEITVSEIKGDLTSLFGIGRATRLSILPELQDAAAAALRCGRLPHSSLQHKFSIRLTAAIRALIGRVDRRGTRLLLRNI